MTLNHETKIRASVLGAYDRAMAAAAAATGCCTEEQIRAGWRAAYHAATIADNERHLLASAATWRGVGMPPEAEVSEAPQLRAAAAFWGARWRAAVARCQELA